LPVDLKGLPRRCDRLGMRYLDARIDAPADNRFMDDLQIVCVEFKMDLIGQIGSGGPVPCLAQFSNRGGLGQPSDAFSPSKVRKAVPPSLIICRITLSSLLAVPVWR
jgi:hypothetical protein